MKEHFTAAFRLGRIVQAGQRLLSDDLNIRFLLKHWQSVMDANTEAEGEAGDMKLSLRILEPCSQVRVIDCITVVQKN